MIFLRINEKSKSCQFEITSDATNQSVPFGARFPEKTVMKIIIMLLKFDNKSYDFCPVCDSGSRCYFY